MSSYVYYKEGNKDAALYNMGTNALFQGSGIFFKYASKIGNISNKVDDGLQVSNIVVGKIVGMGTNTIDNNKNK